MECYCGEIIPQKRVQLGYNTCLDCGERLASQERKRLQRSCVPMHKSNYVPLLGDAKQLLLDISNMRRSE